jgi:hypothetical protein
MGIMRKAIYLLGNRRSIQLSYGSAPARGAPTDCGFLAGPGFARHPLRQG